MKQFASRAYPILAWLVALVLDIQITWGTNGLPPLPHAWVVVWQTMPHLAQAWQAHGLATGIAFAGLVMLSLMQAMLWLASLLILWHLGKEVWMMHKRLHIPSRASAEQLSLWANAPDPGKLSIRMGTHPSVLIPTPIMLESLQAGENTGLLPAATSAPPPCSSASTQCSSTAAQAIALPTCGSLPITLDAATIAASTPWIACQTALREGLMQDEQSMNARAYLAGFVVEGCGGRELIGDAVCERVLDVATETLARLLTAGGRDAVEIALQASIIEANHILAQENKECGTYLSASLAVCLVTSQDVWASATGQSICGILQGGEWKGISDADADLFLGEQDLAREGSVSISHHPFAQADAILLGAGGAWRKQATTRFSDTWTLGATELHTQCQRLVEQAAASTESAASTASTSSAVAGLLMIPEHVPYRDRATNAPVSLAQPGPDSRN